MKMRIKPGTLVGLLAATIALLAAASAVSAAVVYPVKVGPTGRYLVDQNSVPFLMAGESPQAMIGDLSLADAEFFFANRRSHGFNAVWINLLCNSYTGCNDDGSTRSGIAPFATPGDLSTRNEAYFAHAASIVQLAAQYGFLVILDPIETGGWLNVLRANGPAKAYEYGQYLGERFAGAANILWMYGNDFQTWRDVPEDVELLQAVAQGIQDYESGLPPQSRHLHTVELDYPVSSSLDDPTWAPLIQVSAVYTYSPTYLKVLDDYNHPNFLPAFMVEASYEFEQNSPDFKPGIPRILRAQEYWSVLSGATGQLYGNRFTWQFSNNWKSQLDTPGASQMAYLMALFESRRWYDLVPDQTGTVVTSGRGTFGDWDYATAGRTPDGTLAIAYVPSARTLTVALSELSGPVTARWYDPSAGTFADISGSPFPNTGAVSFTSPGNNADGDEDWVLVLEVVPARAELTSPAPGTTLPGGVVTFNWSAGVGAQQYSLSVGTTGPGSFNVYSQGQGTSQSATVNRLPVDGSPVYVRLWTQLGGGTGWVLNDYTYTAVTVDVRGAYTVSMLITQGDRTDPANNGTFPIQGSAIVAGRPVGSRATLAGLGTQTTFNCPASPRFKGRSAALSPS